MRTLGIDPGLAVLGYGLVEGDEDNLEVVDFGTLITPSGESMGERLKTIYEGLQALLERLRPTEMALENFVARNLRSALAVGQARGIVVLAAAQEGLPVYDYSPLKVKQLVTGYGRGSKGQVQEMLRLQLGLPLLPHSPDAADALAVALCHIRHQGLARLLRS